MPAKKRLTMRQLRTLLRLKHGGAGLSDRTIACQIGVARSTIQEYLARVEAAGLSWPLPDDLTDEALDRLLFPRSGCRPGFRRRVEPDWAMVARELKRPGVTLMTLWEEYRESEPKGYGYSRFCDLFRVVRAAPVSGHAPAPRRGRQGVRRLLGQAARGDRPGLGDGAAGGDLRRRPGGVELHLRRGGVDPDAAGLDWRPQPHVRLLRRGAAAGHPGICARAHIRGYVPLIDMWPDIVLPGDMAGWRPHPAT